MNFQTTGNTKIRSLKCCVLFDPADGVIHHVHRVVTMEGAQETSESELEARTLHLAKRKGLDTGRLQVLHVDPAVLARGHHRVDPATRTLVPPEKA